MLNDLDLISHDFANDITIYPIADVHLGAMEHAETEWQDFLKKPVQTSGCSDGVCGVPQE